VCHDGGIEIGIEPRALNRYQEANRCDGGIEGDHVRPRTEIGVVKHFQQVRAEYIRLGN